MLEKEVYHHFASPTGGLPLPFPSAFPSLHPPLPVDQRTHDGRYVWENPALRTSSTGGAFHPPVSHG
ncbi:hypothetical protein V9T40_004073 [Parthenolecanium corni]|uniref:Uncharacterized protein n=1 Tax=Parthenolecanium corni TaxID=536013 RepID=A0AAN9TGV6_9HEMI